MSEKEFGKRLKEIRKQYRAANKKMKAAIQGRRMEMVDEWLSETRNLDEQVEALWKQYRAEAWESIASVVKEAIAKNTD